MADDGRNRSGFYVGGHAGYVFGNANATLADPAFQQWMKDVAAMPAERQVKAVSKKLMELNPGFDGKLTPEIVDGFFEALGDQVITGPTLTNVSDFRAILIRA